MNAIRAIDISAPQKRMSAGADRTGAVFGRLRVSHCLGVAPGGYRWWACICECGKEATVRSRELDRGHTRSCGCLQREYRARVGGRNKLASGVASSNELYASYKKSAESRGHDWALTRDEFDAIIAADCTYCGISKNKTRKPNAGVNGGFRYTGIDRADNRQGYAVGNVVCCCWDCNRAKGVLSEADFRDWITRLVKAARFEHGERG